MTREWSVIKDAREEAPALLPAVKEVSAFSGVVQKPWIGYDDEGEACFGFECRIPYPGYSWAEEVRGESWRARVYRDRVEVEQLRPLPNTRLTKIVGRERMTLRKVVRTLERCSSRGKESRP